MTHGLEMLLAMSALGVGVMLAGCSPSADETDVDADRASAEADLDGLAPTGTSAPDPFCAGLIAADDGLPSDELAAAYRELRPFAPAAIAADFAAVIADLEAGNPTTTPSDDDTDDAPATAETVEPGTESTVDDSITGEVAPAPLEPVEVLAAYIDSVCRQVAVNPLPPPTQPE